MPLSMTTAGREVAGSMRERRRESGRRERAKTVVDLRLRSKEGFKGADHGR